MKKEKKLKVKKPKISNLKKRLDGIFSEYIRRKSIDGFGWIKCVTCGIDGRLEDMDCGHYESRRHNNTRYEERNCAPQCRICNRFEEGRKYEFGKYLVEKYGEATIEYLRQKAKINKKFTIEELQGLIKQYKKKLEDLT